MYIPSPPQPLLAMEPLTLPDLAGLPLDQLDGTRLLEIEDADVVVAVRTGLPVGALERLHDLLDLPMQELAAVLGIPPRTLTRRRQSGRFTPDESDRLLRLARLAELALAVFEDAEAARTWLTEPKRLLGGEAPFAHADTGPGAREVEDMLYAVEFTAAA